ncbi:hypothetical protein [Streptomyces millisiae]|uniref:Uncharacterized protein n=1 Tax=Streptomyces millisiae TaxID=3075542 RepID=A0ABU2LX41_9ACTN|nr:hypothetical protein [Streptomyces sp. DSM 44918]MDT0321762.1 hypothetical protein [Streptomyces sp. DSM 44918]
MDPEIAALAGSAGTTIVTLAATDAWERARDGLVALWRRARPTGADAVGDELSTTRDELATAGPEDTETERELVAQWRGRVRRLLVAHPELESELRALLAELTEEPGRPPAAPTITQHATASGNARVYQAGGDMRIG